MAILSVYYIPLIVGLEYDLNPDRETTQSTDEEQSRPRTNGHLSAKILIAR